VTPNFCAFRFYVYSFWEKGQTKKQEVYDLRG
jgi:hypothetical protein